MSEKGTSLTQQESNGARGATKKRGCAGHCRRFWWIYLLALIVIVVIVVPVVILVAVPKIAQDKLDEAELIVDGIVVSEAEANSYRLSINSTIKSHAGIKATIKPFEGDLYLEDLEGHVPFATVSFPETTSKSLQTVNVSQMIDLKERMGAFTTFNTWLLANETLRVTIKGDTKIRIKGIARDYDVTFKKTVELKGLNAFSGLEVTSAHITRETDEEKPNFNGFVNIPNPSIFTIQIGNASFIANIDDSPVGTVWMNDLTLIPGGTNSSMSARIEQVDVITAVTQQPLCETGVIPFELTGKNVTMGRDELTYYSDALRTSSQTVEIDIAAALKADLNITVSCLD